MQDFNFAPVHSPSATGTKDWTACESLQSLEFCIRLLDFIILLRNMITERNVTKCKRNCLGWRDAIQFGTHIYVTAQIWHMSNKITRRHMMEDSNIHIPYITVYYSQSPLNVSEFACKIQSFGRLNVLISSEGYCKLLLTGSRMMCVSAAACSGLVQFCLSVDPVSHFHTVRHKLETQSL